VRWVVKRGDITQEQVDAIVNAANAALAGGGGVDGAIHRAAGPELADALRKYGGCPTGSAVITPGFRLPARWVIHAVGPVWRGGRQGEARLLASAYAAALERANEVGAATVAFSAISTGVYGYPLDQALAISAAVLETVARRPGSVQEVRLIAFNTAVEEAWMGALGGAAGSWPDPAPP